MSSAPQPPSVLRFGLFEADLRSGELRKSGIRLKIQDRPFQILSILLAQPGQLVTREHIQKRLWPEDTFVDFEHGLNTAINKLRDVLSDQADNPRFIETLPKRGYRFIAPVSSGDGDAATHSATPSDSASAPAQVPATSTPPKPAPQPAKSEGFHLSRVLLAILGLGSLALVVGVTWYLSNRAARSKDITEIRIAPLNGLPREGDAAFSPDGNQVAFVWSGEKGGYAHIYVSQIGAADSPRRLTNYTDPAFEFAPAWSPDGRYIAFFRFDQKEKSLGVYVTAALGGSERRLYSVKSFRKVDALDWSPDGKYLALSDSPNPDSASQILLLSLDTLDVHPVTSPATGILGDSSPAFSPDGKYLAFVRNTLDVLELFRMPAAGGSPVQLTFDHADIQGIAWTPDSQNLIFSSTRQGPQSLWRISAQGGTPERLPLAGAAWALRPAISRKGNRLAFTSVSYTAAILRGKLAADHKVSGPFEHFITSTGLEEGPQYSPDGKRIAFQSTRTGYHEIWRADADGSNPVQLTHFSKNLTGTPRWSPDSRWIAFDSRPGNHPQIFVINAEGGQPRQITQGDSDNAVPSWSMDGKWIYFASNRSGTWQVWKVVPDGGSPAQVTKNGGFAALPSSDGKFLYYAKGRDLPGLWRVPADGGEEAELLSGMPPGGWGYFAVTSDGIYYPDASIPDKGGLYYYDFATKRSSLSFAAGKEQPDNGAPSLAVSPDGHTLLIVFQDQPLVYIMLVENFTP
ncbi:MAG TPA: winged helix-turn-helix domain-containing protein [Terriglobales bacterium]|nr:winged helix-turn-helix domain-containing protein [Terriglobales bacterium]